MVGLVHGGCKEAVAPAAKPEAPAVTVALTAVVEAPAPEQMTLTGIIAPDDSSDVASDVAGKVLQVLVERGQRVAAGAPLLRLDTRSSALGAREAKAMLEMAETNRKLAVEECKRAQQLFDNGAITRAQYDREQTSCAASLQQVAAAQARQELVSKNVADGVVRAPFAGVITEKHASPGEWVAPGMRLVTLVDDEPLRVDLQVPESLLTRIAEKQRVEVESVSHPGKLFSGAVSRISTEIGRMTRALVVEAILDPGSGLLPGMFVSAHLTTGTTLRPAVPETAVVKRGQSWRIFVAVNGRLEERVVQLGAAPGPGQKSILRGLKAGERVVTVVDDQIIDGLSVK
jgi:membrane fusion protein (multidrug efflux system)